MNRILSKLQQVKKAKKKIFCAFVTLGYPNLSATETLIRKFDQDGVDIIELGFPFSDPLADGPTIQYSSQKALEKGVVMGDAFRLVKKLRRSGVKTPILFFTYINPVYHYGFKNFAAAASEAGFDGMIIPDLPPEEEKAFGAMAKKKNLLHIYLVAPTTLPKRAAMIARKSEGFIYYVSLRGVTGARKALASDVERNLKVLKRASSKPVLIGFGVSSPEQAKKLCAYGDGVIVGSAIVEKIRRAGGRLEPALHFVRSLIRSVKEAV